MSDSPAQSGHWVRLVLIAAAVLSVAATVFVGLKLASSRGPGNPANSGPNGLAAPPMDLTGGTRERAISPATAPTEAELGPLPPLAARRLIHVAAVSGIAFSPDGKTIATTGDDKRVRLWDAATGAPLQSFDQGVYGRCVIFTHDAQALVCSFGDGGLHSIDRAKGIELRRFVGHENPVSAIALTPDGKTLVSLSTDLRAWDLAGGKLSQELPVPEGVVLAPGMALSPDGETVAVATGKRTLGIWSVAAGRLLRELPLPGADAKKPEEIPATLPTALAGAPDGRTLAVGTAGGLIHVVSAESARVLFTIRGPGAFKPSEVKALTYSPDGQTLATRREDAVIQLYEAQTGKPVLSLPGHEGLIYALAFAPDGRWLASATTDKAVVIWDLTRAGGQPRPLTDADLARLWADLGGEDPAAAYAAGWVLASGPDGRAGETAVAFLRTKLKPETVEAAQLQTWVQQLDDADFGVREAATAKLRQLGPAAGRALREAMEATASEEVKERGKKLLETMYDPSPPRAQDRGVAVLERIGSAEAKALLQTLGGGTEGLSLTDHAQAALKRLAARN